MALHTPSPVLRTQPGRTATADKQWSPVTGDLVAEMPALVRSVRSDGFVLRRIMFNPADWDSPVPRKLMVDGEVVKLGAFHYQHSRTVTLVDDDGRSRVTLHLPPVAATAPQATS